MPVPPLKPRRRPTAGFTLVDVMMGAVILVVGFMGMIQAVTIGSEMLATARRQTLASQIINHELDQLRLLPWDDPSSSNDITGLAAGPTTITIDSQFTAAVAASGATYTLSRSVSNVVSGSLREVTFTVTWTVRPSGISASRTYTRKNSAYFGKYGLNLAYQRS